MACASLVILVVEVIGCKLTEIRIPNLFSSLIAFAIVLAGIQAIPVYWHSKGRKNLRDAALTIPWFMVFVLLLPYAQDVAARFGMGRPLQDALFVRADNLLGISVPAIVHWSGSHRLGMLANKSYYQLVPFAYLSFILIAFTGKAKRAQEFVAINYISLIVGTPLFGLLPAIGPWYGFHFPATVGQVQTQADLLLLRQPGPYLHHYCGVICFPSGHVIGAIMAAYLCWEYVPLRIPAAAFSGLIIFSTMTTGWHYFIDVLGGVVVAVIAIAAARWLVRLSDEASPQEVVAPVELLGAHSETVQTQ